MILPRAERELGLQEQLIAGNDLRLQRDRNHLPDRSFVVVLALVRRVDTAKALAQCKLGEALRVVFLPRGSIQEAGHTHSVDYQRGVTHDALRSERRAEPVPRAAEALTFA